jgi:NADPH-dependent F420 reductase
VGFPIAYSYDNYFSSQQNFRWTKMTVLKIAIIGGTGPQGKGLGYRFAKAGHHVALGSRLPDRAASAADELASRMPASASIRGTDNASAANDADVVVLAIPFNGHRQLLLDLRPHLDGKIVVSCVNPLGFDQLGPFGIQVEEGSAAEQAAALLPDSKIVGAFHHLSAVSLLGDAELLVNDDVLVCSDDAEARQIIVELARSITGKPGIVAAGGLRLARYLEPFTAVLISINKQYKTHAGVLISGLPDLN